MGALNKSLDALAVYVVDAAGTQIIGLGNPSPSTADSSLSGTITSSGSVISITFVNNALQEFINPSTAPFWARWNGIPAANGAGSFQISPGGSFTANRVSGSLMVISTATNQPYTVNRYS